MIQTTFFEFVETFWFWKLVLQTVETLFVSSSKQLSGDRRLKARWSSVTTATQ